MPTKNVLGLLKSMINELPKAEKRIAEKILEHPEQIVHMTASELGEAAKSSAATVIRLSKRLKIGSFTELKVLISRDIETEDRYGYSDIEDGEPMSSIMDKLYWNSSLAMRDTVSMLEEKALNDAVELIRDASVIYTFGVGASSLGAENISHKWSRIGKTCLHIKDSHILLASLVASESDAVFIGISNSGETQEVIKLDELARLNGHKTIAITRFGGNTLANNADISLQHVRSNEIQTRSAATSSLHVQFLVIDILFYLYVSRNYDKALDKIYDSRSAIDNFNGDKK